jgi:hypothetical protein
MAGRSFSSLSDSLTFGDLRARFIEHAVHDFDIDFDFHRLLPFADGFERNRVRQRHDDDTSFDGLGRRSWIDEFLGGRRGWIPLAPGPRPFCKLPQPPVVPEPETGLLLAGGLAGLSFVGRKRRTRRAAQGVS